MRRSKIFLQLIFLRSSMKQMLKSKVRYVFFINIESSIEWMILEIEQEVIFYGESCCKFFLIKVIY